MNRPTDRDMNTAIYLLRAKQIGLSLAEMEEIEEGQIVDMMTESANDSFNYGERASQEDMDRF